MSDTISEPDEVIYMVGLDGTGSMRPCSKEDDGAVTYIRADHIDAQDAKIKGLVEALCAARKVSQKGSLSVGLRMSKMDDIARAALATAKEPK